MKPCISSFSKMVIPFIRMKYRITKPTKIVSDNLIKLLLSSFIMLISGVMYSQINLDSLLQDDENVDWDKELIEVVKIDDPVYKPIVSFGAGIFNYYGELNKENKDITSGRIGYNLDIFRTLNPNLKFGFRFIYGELAGESTLGDYDKVNFESQLFAFGVHMDYNFLKVDFSKKKRQYSFSPYISLGAEFLDFEPHGDLYDSDGNRYYNWSDGTTRLLEELPGNYQTPIVERDKEYETSLVELNIDGLDNTNPIAIGFPIDIGFDFIMSQKASCRLGYSHHFTINDGIDNITSKGFNYDNYPEREGDKRNDRFSYTYISFSLDLFSRTTEEKQLQFMDLGVGGVFDFWDMDGDFVMDIYDECPWTPFRQLVDTSGCPLDADKDNVPNFADREESTPEDAFYVNIDGEEVEEPDLLAMLNDSKSLPQEDIYRHYPSLLEGTGLYRRFYKNIPEKFQSLDVNDDNFISLEELLNAIDNFFDLDSNLTVDDLYELNEFFFIQ